jgi:hypothetical protein
MPQPLPGLVQTSLLNLFLPLLLKLVLPPIVLLLRALETLVLPAGQGLLNFYPLPKGHPTLDLLGCLLWFRIKPGGIGVNCTFYDYIVVMGFAFPAANTAMTGGLKAGRIK